jgi:hypothetical protein
MREGDGEKLSKIEELKSRLYSKSYETHIEHRDNFSNNPGTRVMDSWNNIKTSGADMTQKFFTKTSFFKKFFVFSVIFFCLTLGYASYTFFSGGNSVSNNNIDISILGNTFTAGGEELPLQIAITNKNTSALELVDLVVEYPKSSSGDLSKETERSRTSLGTIPAGAVRNENIKITLFGEQGSVRPVRVSIEYRVEGSNAIFVKEKMYQVNINSTPIDLSVNAPASISPNQDLNMDVTATLNSSKSLDKVLLKIDYPVGFQFISSIPDPSYGDNVWNFGDLAPGTPHKISITGRMIDVFDGEEKNFRIWSGSQSKTDKSMIDVVFNSLGQTVTIEKSSIEAKLFVNGVYQKDYAINAASELTGEIKWANNLDTNINDLEIRAKLSGTALDRKSISADQGFYDSASDTIIWDKNYQSGFQEVSPGDAGTVSFSLKPSALFSAGGGLLGAPAIKVDVSIRGKQAVAGYEAKDLNNGESKTIKVISDVGLATKALYYSGAFTNSGPIPPKAEKETTYTVVWSISNTANNISRATVHSSLPPWVRYIGPVSPESEDLTYNATTKELTWNAGNVPKGAGLTGSARQVSFKIGFSPSLSQVGQTPLLTNDATLTGHDDFANVDIRVNKTALTTRLSSDPAFPAGGDRVTE